MKYLVSHQGFALGPLGVDEIVAKVRAKELDLFDFVFDEAKEDWVLMMEFTPIAGQLKSAKPPRPPQKAEVEAPIKVEVRKETAPETISPHTINEWFVLKGDNRFGPFVYGDLVKMLQQKVLFPFDFVWHSGLDSWKRAAELEEFNAETIRHLFAQGQKQEIFAERKFKRKAFTGRVLIHDNLTLWKGEGFEISRGGAGISMRNSVVIPGQRVFVHFNQHGEWPAFNAVCEVVSKKFVSDDSPVQYGLRFLSLSQEVQEEFYKKVA